ARHPQVRRGTGTRAARTDRALPRRRARRPQEVAPARARAPPRGERNAVAAPGRVDGDRHRETRAHPRIPSRAAARSGKGVAVEYRTLGRTGMTVSSYCLGTMMFGRWGNPDEGECAAMVRTALDAGINFVDTADVYDFGTSEEFLGRAIAGVRDDLIV